jgi:hypothetical protein
MRIPHPQTTANSDRWFDLVTPSSIKSNINSSIPVGTNCKLPHDPDHLRVGYTTYVRHALKKQPNAEVSAKDAAIAMVASLSIVDRDLEVKIHRGVDKPTIKIPNSKNNEKIWGYFTISIANHRNESNIDRLQLLKGKVQQVICQDIHQSLSSSSNMPKYIPVICYNIYPVNYDKYMPVGLFGGFPSDIINEYDVMGRDKFIEEVVHASGAVCTDEKGNPIPSHLDKRSKLSPTSVLFLPPPVQSKKRVEMQRQLP